MLIFVVKAETSDGLVKFSWDCGCYVSFTTEGQIILPAEFDEDALDVWSMAERQNWKWLAELACKPVHGGTEVRTARDESAKPGGKREAIIPAHQWMKQYTQKFDYSPQEETAYSGLRQLVRASV